MGFQKYKRKGRKRGIKTSRGKDGRILNVWEVKNSLGSSKVVLLVGKTSLSERQRRVQI